MIKTGQQKAAGQAATELAVFGAILIFILGTIVRTAAGSSYSQDQNFKAMRMAMLSSWQGTLGTSDTPPHNYTGPGKGQDLSHNSASILFVEDRLTPDNGKYGDLDRNPYIAQGSGTFTYNLLYPLSDAEDFHSSLPIMDVYINGAHFPFTTAAYVIGRELVQPGVGGAPACSLDGPYYPLNEGGTVRALTQAQCLQNQCLRNQREWTGGYIKESSLLTPSVAPISPIGTACLTQFSGATQGVQQRECQEARNACTVYQDLAQAKIVSSPLSMPTKSCTVLNQSFCTAADPTSCICCEPQLKFNGASALSTFEGIYQSESFPGLTSYKSYFAAIQNILKGGQGYKLFYNIAVNPGGGGATTSGNSTLQFTQTPPTCNSHPCKDKELSGDVRLKDAFGNLTDVNNNPVTDGYGNITNIKAVMQYDLLRNADYVSNSNNPNDAQTLSSVYKQFPLPVGDNGATAATCDLCMRNDVAWQWSATAATSADMIGLNPDQNQYPSYDIDGRLKEVSIYKLQQSNGSPVVDYEDPAGGDIDQSWDMNSCGPKPGLQPESEIYTFTQQGTYLQIKEGQLYNPETGQVVRSANKRDTIDLIQRTIQLSNNTGRFCQTGTYGTDDVYTAHQGVWTPVVWNPNPPPKTSLQTKVAYVGMECSSVPQGYPATTCDGLTLQTACGSKCCPEGDTCTSDGRCNPIRTANCPSSDMAPPAGTVAIPNPVEVCVDGNTCNCFMDSIDNPKCGDTIKQTCYDTSTNRIFVRSRLQDRRGHFWITNATGQLNVH